ncbi:MAG: helix-turn-helix transcriptional regulator [Pseudomonadota bacterium]
MTKNQLPSHYIKEWRSHRGLSLRKLAERMESSPGEEMISAMSLSRIERGIQPYSQPILEALSIALNTTPWALISVNPEVEGDVVDMFSYLRGMSSEERQKALRLLKVANS